MLFFSSRSTCLYIVTLFIGLFAVDIFYESDHYLEHLLQYAPVFTDGKAIEVDVSAQIVYLNTSINEKGIVDKVVITENRMPLTIISSKLERYCQDEEMAVGRWVKRNSTVKPFLCCSRYNRKTPECVERKEKGIWLIDFVDGCCCNYTLTWKPDNCKVLEWDTPLFCKLIDEYRFRVLVAGDSIAEQHYGLLRTYTETIPTCQKNIYFAEADTLIGIRMGNRNHGPPIEVTLLNHIKSSLAEARRPLFIVSGGPHMHTIGNFSLALNYTAGMLKKLANRMSFFWIPQAPSHVGCRDYKGNVLEPGDYEKYKEYQKTAPKPFNWHLFGELHDMVYRVIGPKRMLHTHKPLLPRWDGHIHFDCLHWCTWSLLNMATFLLQSLVNQREQFLAELAVWNATFIENHHNKRNGY